MTETVNIFDLKYILKVKTDQPIFIRVTDISNFIISNNFFSQNSFALYQSPGLHFHHICDIFFFCRNESTPTISNKSEYISYFFV